MSKLEEAYRYINILSIDVACGAVCSAIFFSKFFKVHILPFGLISLGLTVWIIYTVDHLADARKIKATAITSRHQFHQQYFGALSKIVFVALMVDLIVILFIRRPVFINGILMAIGVALYLVINRHLKFFKEISIAILYTAGTVLPSVSVTPLSYHQWPWLLMLQFLMTAFANLILFSWYDRAADGKEGTPSIALLWGDDVIKRLMIMIFCLNVGISFFKHDTPSYIVMFMHLILMIIFMLPRVFKEKERFRLWGDVVFFLPVLFTI
jgi:4-hydroxybenzoate polyprenyltransferase